MKSKKSWRSKLESDHPYEVKEGPDPWNKKYGGSKMLIATPKMVDDAVKAIPKGKLKSIGQLRADLAEQCEADYACPLTTGIFLRIAAEAAEESKREGQKNITPYWRMVYDDGTLNPKFPGGMTQQASYLQQEGFVVIPKGKAKMMVRDFEKFLY